MAETCEVRRSRYDANASRKGPSYVDGSGSVPRRAEGGAARFDRVSEGAGPRRVGRHLRHTKFGPSERQTSTRREARVARDRTLSSVRSVDRNPFPPCEYASFVRDKLTCEHVWPNWIFRRSQWRESTAR